jgi:hypothetical protein
VRVRPLLLGRVFAASVGLAYSWAAAVTVAKIYRAPSVLGNHGWPVFAGQSAILGVIALLTLTGATMHVADLVVASAAMVALMIANIDSESTLAPAVGISTILLAFVYVRAGWGSMHLLSVVRRLTLVGAVIFVVAAIMRMQEPTFRVDWQRVRTPAGGIQLGSSPTPGTCRDFIAGAKDVDEIDSGCIDVMPAKRAGYVIAFATLSGALAVAGVARAPRVRSLPDGTTVPTWT